MSENVYHIPALLEPTIQGLDIRPGGVYVDLTFGGGGHSRAILQQKIGKLYSFDQDIDAYNNASEDFKREEGRHWQFVHSNFRYLAQWMDYYGVTEVDGLLADLGVSFHHFDTADRGFSFRFEGPLDMRMNQRSGLSAAEVVNDYTEEELARVLWMYGELHQARRLARRIVTARAERRIERTEQLVQVLGEDKKLLTLVFQALRIEVNDELGALQQMLLSAGDLLKTGGRIAILTYHSLEDRIVKNYLRSGNLTGEVQKDFYGNILSPFRLIEKGRTASADEVARNPRARSAKLRIAQKL